MTDSDQPAKPGARRNIRLVIEYDGTNYVGWQLQKNGVSVQEKVEKAVGRHLGEPVRLSAAGRTDAGVHAMGQVANFFTTTQLTPRAILKGSLPHLPRDITLLKADEVPPTFDSRKSARMRWYRYYICNRGTAPALGRNYVTHVPFKLDVEKMKSAASVFTGDHDFSGFRAVTCTAVRTQLTMHPIEITQLPDNILVFDYRCQSFLQNMVRILTGTIIACGRDRISISQIEEMLRSGKRVNEAVTLPPNGLFLYRVLYEGDPGLPGFA
jgi:tRNA pseudouridine38-40 synthase